MAETNSSTRTNAQTSRPGWRPGKHRTARVRETLTDAERMAQAEAMAAMFRRKDTEGGTRATARSPRKGED